MSFYSLEAQETQDDLYINRMKGLDIRNKKPLSELLERTTERRSFDSRGCIAEARELK